MKRKNYSIESTAGHSAIKHAWNSGRRKIEQMVGDLATEENTTYQLTASETTREGHTFLRGAFTWRSNAGREVIFSINLQE